MWKTSKLARPSFVEKRKDLLQHLQDTRLRLHEVHMRTMEQGSDGAEEGGADVATAQEALDATMQFEEQETPVLDQDFAKIKKELTGVVKQVKDTIEDKLRGRDRSRSRSKKEPDEVEILEPAPKRLGTPISLMPPCVPCGSSHRVHCRRGREP